MPPMLPPRWGRLPHSRGHPARARSATETTLARRLFDCLSIVAVPFLFASILETVLRAFANLRLPLAVTLLRPRLPADPPYIAAGAR